MTNFGGGIEIFRPRLTKYCWGCVPAEADLGMCGLCGRTGAPTKRGPPHEDKHKFFIAANLLQHAEKSLN